MRTATLAMSGAESVVGVVTAAVGRGRRPGRRSIVTMARVVSPGRRRWTRRGAVVPMAGAVTAGRARRGAVVTTTRVVSRGRMRRNRGRSIIAILAMVVRAAVMTLSRVTAAAAVVGHRCCVVVLAGEGTRLREFGATNNVSLVRQK